MLNLWRRTGVVQAGRHHHSDSEIRQKIEELLLNRKKHVVLLSSFVPFHKKNVNASQTRLPWLETTHSYFPAVLDGKKCFRYIGYAWN